MSWIRLYESGEKNMAFDWLGWTCSCLSFCHIISSGFVPLFSFCFWYDFRLFVYAIVYWRRKPCFWNKGSQASFGVYTKPFALQRPINVHVSKLSRNNCKCTNILKFLMTLVPSSSNFRTQIKDYLLLQTMSALIGKWSFYITCLDGNQNLLRERLPRDSEWTLEVIK